ATDSLRQTTDISTVALRIECRIPALPRDHELMRSPPARRHGSRAGARREGCRPRSPSSRCSGAGAPVAQGQREGAAMPHAGVSVRDLTCHWPTAPLRRRPTHALPRKGAGKEDVVRAPVAVGLCALLMAVPSLVTAQSRATFGKARLIVSRGDETEAVKVHLVFHEDRLEIRADETRTLLKTFPYERITNAEYSYSKRPRWKSGAVLAGAVGVFALPVFFMKGTRHWL